MESKAARQLRWSRTSSQELHDLLTAWESQRDWLESKTLLGDSLTKRESERLHLLKSDCWCLADHLNQRD
jgi:hypothetical protein